MKLTVDADADALYLGLTEGTIAETREVAPGVLLDYNADGQVVGIELLSVSRSARKGDLNRLLFETIGLHESVSEPKVEYGREHP